MGEYDFDEDLAAICAAGPLEEQVRAVERVGEAVRLATTTVVGSLVSADGDPDRQYLIFERLGRFGSLAVEPLEAALGNTVGATRTLVAAALHYLGSDAGEQHLLAAVTLDNSLMLVAVHALVRVVPSPHGTDRVVLAALRACEVSNAAVFDTLFQAVLRLGVAIPDDVVARLQIAQPEWRRRGLLRDVQ